jgi:hypothetical protein
MATAPTSLASRGAWLKTGKYRTDVGSPGYDEVTYQYIIKNNNNNNNTQPNNHHRRESNEQEWKPSSTTTAAAAAAGLSRASRWVIVFIIIIIIIIIIVFDGLGDGTMQTISYVFNNEQPSKSIKAAAATTTTTKITTPTRSLDSTEKTTTYVVAMLTLCIRWSNAYCLDDGGVNGIKHRWYPNMIFR